MPTIFFLKDRDKIPGGTVRVPVNVTADNRAAAERGLLCPAVRQPYANSCGRILPNAKGGFVVLNRKPVSTIGGHKKFDACNLLDGTMADNRAYTLVT